jgi:hypothetical protein
MMMQTMDELWTASYSDEMHWGDFNHQCFSDCAWQQWDLAAMDPSMCYGQGHEFESNFNEDWSEDWGRRAPKFPPPDVPAPAVIEGMTLLQQAALESQAMIYRNLEAQFEAERKSSIPTRQKTTAAKGVIVPPGLDASAPMHVESPVSSDIPRPRPLGLASMMELASELKDPLHRTITPETTAPPTPASSLSEFEGTVAPVTLPSSGVAPGCERQMHDNDASPDVGSGYSLFGSSPWPALPLGVGCPGFQITEDVCKGEKDGSPTCPPPGLFPPGNLLAGPPPGLEEAVRNGKMTKRPPGLELATVAELPEEDKTLESVSVEQGEVHEIACTRAVWRIVQLRGRLKTSLGKPVVSPAFTIPGLGEIRLMVTPDAKGTLEGMRGKGKQSHFAKMLSQGPLECTLKVKVPCTSTPVVKFYLTVGPNRRQGPFTCDFSQHTVHGCNDFDCDWLKQVDDEGCLCVGLEIVEICADGQRLA